MIENECEECADIFEVYPSNSDQKYCSRECYLGENNPSKDKDKKITVSCEECGNKFKRIKSLAKRTKNNFCDYSCSNSWRENNICGENHPQFEGGKDGFSEDWKDNRKVCLKIHGKSCIVHDCKSSNTIHVHHLIPRKYFDDLKKADSIWNLVTVCSRHHPKIEYETKELLEMQNNSFKSLSSKETARCLRDMIYEKSMKRL